MEAAAIPHEYSETAPVVTLSIGLATHSDDDIKVDTRQLQQSADRALYRA